MLITEFLMEPRLRNVLRGLDEYKKCEQDPAMSLRSDKSRGQWRYCSSKSIVVFDRLLNFALSVVSCSQVSTCAEDALYGEDCGSFN